jgi:ABC-2 type transport system permease protein
VSAPASQKQKQERGSGEVRLIAGRELRERLRAKSFAISTGVLIVAILAIGIAARVIGSDEAEATVVGVAGEAPEGFDQALGQVAEAIDRDVEVVRVDVDPADEAGIRKVLEDGDADVVIDPSERSVVHDGDVDDELQAIVQQAWSSTETRQALVDDEGIDADRVDELLSPEPLAATALEEDSSDDEVDGVAALAGTAAAVMLFTSLQVFGSYALVGVVEEKASAVVELLLVRVRADQLLAGKLIGIGVVALLQFVLAIVAGMVSLAISGVDVPGDIWSALPMAIVWFLGGFAFYSTLFALAGSLVSRQEDAQAAAAPFFIVMIGAYMLVFITGYVPTSMASRILSVLPPIAPFLMPMRMAAGAASVVEIVVALVLLLGATVAAWKLAGRIYEQVLLRRGSRIPWSEALALLRPGSGPAERTAD